jgi:hypothetical protein
MDPKLIIARETSSLVVPAEVDVGGWEEKSPVRPTYSTGKMAGTMGETVQAKFPIDGA